jgi:hypothetical protein
MENKIDLSKIFGQIWGYVGLPFPEIIIRGIPTAAQQKFAADSFPDMMTAKYLKTTSEKGVSYRTGDSDLFMPVWISEIENNALEYLLPNAVTSLSSQMHIVTTNLVNRDGSVKEQIAASDWEIRIRGVLIGEGENYPESETQLLVDWYKKKKALYIQNVRTAICLQQREKVIMSNLELKELRGFENIQPYEIQLVSDIEFDLYIA